MSIKKFNEKFEYLLVKTNNLQKLLIMCRFPGIKIDINDRVKYVEKLINYYIDNYDCDNCTNVCTDYESEQIENLVYFIDNKLKNVKDFDWDICKKNYKYFEFKLNTNYLNQQHCQNYIPERETCYFEDDCFEESCY
jgi:hypothetical protein